MRIRILGIAITLLVIGCQNKLETGYKPVVLGASSAERRGYYAQPFTPERKAAQLEREQEYEARRPKPGF